VHNTETQFLPQREQPVTYLLGPCVVLFREIIALYFHSHTKHNLLHVWSAELLMLHTVTGELGHVKS